MDNDVVLRESSCVDYADISGGLEVDFAFGHYLLWRHILQGHSQRGSPGGELCVWTGCGPIRMWWLAACSPEL